MRHIVIDTETTGFSRSRIVEIAAVHFDPSDGSVIERISSYIDPQGTPIEAGAERVHGISAAQLRGAPTFERFAPRFVEFVRGATLYAHNAPFDRRVLDGELARTPHGPLEELAHRVVCTLAMARERYPELARHKLDQLCDHLGVDRAARDRHGALIDCELLAQCLGRMLEAAPSPRAPEPHAAPVTHAERGQGPQSETGFAAGGAQSRRGTPWSDEERLQLVRGWRANPDLEALSAVHGRTALALAMQLLNPGEIAEERFVELMGVAPRERAPVAPARMAPARC